MAAADARGRARRADGIVAAGCAALTLCLLIAFPAIVALEPDSGSGAPVLPAPLGAVWWITAVALVAQASAILAARLAPRAVPILVAAIGVALDLAAPSELHGLSLLAVMAAVVLGVLRMPLRRLWPSLATASVLVVAGETVAGIASDRLAPLLAFGQGALQPVAAVGIPLVIALLVRSQRELRRALRAERSATERERDARVAEVVARERAAMARELHDIAAHHLSGIALMLGVVDRQIDSDPPQAHAGVRQIREQAGSVLDDLRRLVGLLRDDGAAERSVEALAAIPALVDRSARHGAVELQVLTDPHRELGAGIGPLAQLAAFRTVQEALANVAMHAAGATCTVTVDDRDPHALAVTVQNAAPPPGSGALRGPGAPAGISAGGYGLRGMRERAGLVGAELRTGPSDDGGWSVELVIARERARAEARAETPS